MPSSVFSLLARYLRPQAGRVTALGLCLLASIGAQLFIPRLTRSFIDGAIARSAMESLSQLALLFLALSIGNQLLTALASYLAADVGWKSTNSLREHVFRHALSLSMGYHKDRTPGEMIERLDGDITSISNFFSQFIVRVSTAVLMVFGVLILLWQEDWRAGLVLTLFTLTAMLILHWRRKAAVEPTRLEREISAQVFGFIEERLAGLDDIRANGAGPYVKHRFLELQREWFARASRAWWLRGTVFLAMGVLFNAGSVLALGLGLALYFGGSITLGTVYLFYQYMLMLESPLDQITQQLQEFQKATAGIQRAGEILSLEPAPPDGAAMLPAQGAARVEFDQVRFRYAKQEVLKGITFELAPGETLGLLGRTGSGKTTLIRLLFRLYDASEGAVRIDGVDLRETRARDLHRRAALVTQEVQLFHGTVRDNLTFFNPSIPDSRIRAVLDELGISQWIATLPQGLDTVLESSGGGLSAGQAQLLAFARVFLHDPGLVILDEPSSRLDPATERLLTNALDTLLRGRTAVIIAHRLATVERVDKIMVLRAGEIVEFGRRADLAADPASHYARLRALAAGDDSIDAHVDEVETIAETAP
jgi:ABC-type multidrug transport system fused ATPase/permease subunit